MTDSKNTNASPSPSTYNHHDFTSTESLQIFSLSGLRTEIAALADLIGTAFRR